VLEAARQCGASAVHPGGGALAADGQLARAVLDAGLAWVGAAPEVLDRLELDAPRQHAGRHLSAHLLADGEVVPLAVLDVTPTDGEVLVACAPPPGVAELAPVVDVAVRAAADSGLRGVASAQVAVQPDGSVALQSLRPWLPVEHPVSELLCGPDLVEQQLRLAAGAAAAPVAVASDASSALLLRVYAEPVAGEQRLTAWREPSGVRVDSGFVEGDVVLPWYDPLLATVTVAGPTREDVLAAARTAVDGFRVEGVRTTLPRLATVLADPSLFAA
jgi:acetyl-CoA carboxylase, biotin carboxylase subunit